MNTTRRSRALLAAVCLAGAFAAGYVTRHLLGFGAGAPVAPSPAVEEDHPPPTPAPAAAKPDARLRKPTVRPLEGWKRCMAIELSNPGRTIEDYSVRFDLPRAEGMLPDCRDLRFTDSGRSLPFWIESTDDDEVAAWVRIPEIVKGRTKIVLSYGNPAAESASDGEATFLLFDDFKSGFDSGKWQRSRDAGDGGAGAFIRDGVMHVQGGDNLAKGWLTSLVDLPNRVAVESRMKVDRKNDYCKGGLRIRGQGKEKLSVGIDYNFYSYEAERMTFANRDSFAVHFNDYPNPERAGVRLPGFWRDVWFRQRLAYDGTSAPLNLVYARDKGDGLERLAADVPQTRSSVRISVEPWAYYRWPTQFFQIDWIAARNYSPVRLEATVSGPEGGDVRRSVFDDGPPRDVLPDPWPEGEQEVF
ncbi:MAG: DUF2341 domain-containing protein [Planctomycetota bacterium]